MHHYSLFLFPISWISPSLALHSSFFPIAKMSLTTRPSSKASKSPSQSSLSSHLAMLDLKSRILSSLSKLSDRDTHQIAVDDLENIISSLPADGFPMFLSSLLHDPIPSPGDPTGARSSPIVARRESIRLLALLCAAYPDSAAAHLPKIINLIVRRLKDPVLDASLRDACGDAAGSLAAIYLRSNAEETGNGRTGAAAPVAGLFVKPLLEVMGEQSKTVQAGAAMCLGRVVEGGGGGAGAAAFQRLCPRICKMIGAQSCLAKGSLLSVLSKLAQVRFLQLSLCCAVLTLGFYEASSGLEEVVCCLLMELQNTPFTVQLGRGASIQLANAVINTGNSEATIQFGSLEFPVATAMATAVHVHGITVSGHTARPNSAETYARRVNSVQQPRAARIATAKAIQQNRTSVFERLSHPEVSTVKKTDIKQKTLPILSSVITLPTEPFVPGRHDHEASSSGGKLSRRQRRKLNAKLRAQQSLPVHSSTLPALEPEANVPTQNNFANLKWVKRNSSTGELKQSFWEQQQQAPAPQKKKYETLSARVHRVLKVARENGLMKKKYQRPFINKTARIPSRELPAARVTQEKLKSTPRGEHWSMKPELRIQESADKRSRWKGKEIWRPRLPERKLLEKNVRIGVTSGIASQRSASKKNHQQWVPKEKVPITNAYNSRHLGESSKESYCQPTSTYQKEINVDRTPPIEEVPMPHAEPEIYWKRRSEIRVQGNDDEEDTMEVEVVYMVGHGDEPHQTRGYKRRNEPGPTSSKTTTSQEEQIQYEQLEEEEVPSGDDQNDDQEEVLAETLAQAQRRLKFQMKEKDKEISELNSKMTEMMAQMTAMMQLMQKNIITNPALAQPADHQNSIPTNLSTNPVPQVSGIRTAHEEENEADRLDHLQTHQNVASASEPVMTPQLESIINEKIKAVIASEQVEKFTAISKKTMKMIKQLEGVPGIKWKSSIEPVLELKENQNSGASTSRSLSWRRPKTKRFYKTSSKKSGNPNKRSKLKEKRTVLQKIINNLEDYHQPMRRPITLADFMSKLQIDPSEVEEDEQEDEELLHVEICRVISVASTAYQRDSIKDHDRSYITISPTKMINKMTSESCLMVLQTDDNSEEELCFPSDDESDQQITSQREHAKLNEDSEHTIKTSSDEAESNEVDQVQLRSGKVLPPPLKKGISSKDKGKDIIINEEIIPKDHKKKYDTNKGIEYNIISHLRKIPAQLSIYEALLMSKDLRETLIQALKNPERYEAYFAER
ncbi:hypothetical protein M5K25_002306 [Dendrobium thyrsiflorum]|uniref:TORTIFOLIA1/SINE1-2 N-terminal domain-containing protein n=1 Tax=Dendrobium thyrsiflorum TaxID=117978 RepID=A0ABD0VSL0_DENTH